MHNKLRKKVRETLLEAIVVTLGITVPLFIVAKIIGALNDDWLTLLVNTAAVILTGIIAYCAFKTYHNTLKAHKDEAEDRRKEARNREIALVETLNADQAARLERETFEKSSIANKMFIENINCLRLTLEESISKLDFEILKNIGHPILNIDELKKFLTEPIHQANIKHQYWLMTILISDCYSKVVVPKLNTLSIKEEDILTHTSYFLALSCCPLEQLQTLSLYELTDRLEHDPLVLPSDYIEFFEEYYPIAWDFLLKRDL